MKTVTKRNALVVLLLVFSLAPTMVIGASQDGGSGPGQEVMELSLSVVVATSDPEYLAAVRFSELVSEKTDGAVKITVYPAGQLGNQRESLEGVQVGTVDMYISGDDLLSNYYPPMAAIVMPFMWTDLDQLHRLNDSAVGRDLFEALAREANFRVIASFDRAPRGISNSVRPINSAADVKGLKIRVPGNDVITSIFRALGAEPTPVDWNEIYTSLSLGLVDGQDNGIDVTHAAKLDEVQKYYSFTNHIMMGMRVVMNEPKFQGLPDEYKSALIEAGSEAAQYRLDLLDQSLAGDREAMEANGMQFLTPDLSSFRDATANVWRTFVDKYGSEFEQYYMRIREEVQ